MKLNEIVLKDLFSHAPAGENFRFVFLVENEALEDKILQAGYMAVGISDEPQKAVFLKIYENGGNVLYGTIKSVFYEPAGAQR